MSSDQIKSLINARLEEYLEVDEGMGQMVNQIVSDLMSILTPLQARVELAEREAAKTKVTKRKTKSGSERALNGYNAFSSALREAGKVTVSVTENFANPNTKTYLRYESHKAELKDRGVEVGKSLTISELTEAVGVIPGIAGNHIAKSALLWSLCDADGRKAVQACYVPK